MAQTACGIKEKGVISLNAVEELERILTCEALIESKTEEYIRLCSLAEKMTAAINGEAVSGSRNLDPLGTVVVSKEKLFNEIAQLQKDYEKLKAFLSGIIDGLRKPVYIKILYGIYFIGKELKEVANEIGYSYRHTQDLRDVAIQEVQKIMDEHKSSHKIS